MIKRFLTPPVFEDIEKTATAKLLYIILGVNVAACVIFLIPFYFISPGSFVRYLALSTITITTCALSLITARRGRVTLGSSIFLASLWVSIMTAAYISGGITSSLYAGAFVLTVLAGLLLGDHAAIVTALASIAAGTLMVFAEVSGRIPTPPEQDSLSRLLSYTFFISLTVIFQLLSTRTIRLALSKSQAELAERLHTEQALRLSEERYRLITSVSTDYMFSTKLGEDGNLHLNWVAGAFEQITGYTFDEYVEHGGWAAHIAP